MPEKSVKVNAAILKLVEFAALHLMWVPSQELVAMTILFKNDRYVFKEKVPHRKVRITKWGKQKFVANFATFSFFTQNFSRIKKLNLIKQYIHFISLEKIVLTTFHKFLDFLCLQLFLHLTCDLMIYLSLSVVISLYS